MRINHKYKSLSKVSLSVRIPTRIEKFKRPKWQRIQKYLKKISSRKRNFRLFKIDKSKVRLKNWVKLRRHYKHQLETKHKIELLYDTKKTFIPKKYSKKKIEKKKEVLYNHYYHLCSLLWYLNFFRSSFQAKQEIDSRNIILNKNILRKDLILKKGDLIEIKNQKIKLKDIKKNYISQNLFFSHLEVDYYSQNIILLKNLEELNKLDLQFLAIESFNVDNFRIK